MGPQVEGYRAWLAQRGYTTGTIQNMLADLAQVGQRRAEAWVGPGDDCDPRVDGAAEDRQRLGDRRVHVRRLQPDRRPPGKPEQLAGQIGGP